MLIRVLGPLRVEQDGVPVTPSAPKPKQALALLLVKANDVVSATDLIKELWDDRPPPSATATLQTYILRLRKNLASGNDPGARSTLLTVASGYMMRLTQDNYDLLHYRALTEAARNAIERCALERAAVLLDRAARLWRGPALDDVRPGTLLAREIARLEEAHLNTLEERIDVYLRLHRHAEILDDLSELCARYPMHEDLHGQLMICLYRCGLRQEALAAYWRLNAILVDELGLDPSAKLKRLHKAIATGEVEDQPANDAPGTARGWSAVDSQDSSSRRTA